jgi:hypothetical protein
LVKRATYIRGFVELPDSHATIAVMKNISFCSILFRPSNCACTIWLGDP